MAARDRSRYPRAVTRYLMKITVPLALALAVTACGRYSRSDAAVVNGVRITMKQLDATVERARADERTRDQLDRGGAEALLELRRQALIDLVRGALIRSELRRNAIGVTDALVEDRIRIVRNSFPSIADYQQALRAQNIDESAMRDRFRETMPLELLQQKVAPVAVTNEEIRRAYDQARPQYEQAHIRHILFSTRSNTPDQALEKANRALGRIRDNADFATLARTLSEDSSRQAGGDIGFLSRAQLPEDFARVAFSIALRTVSAPIRTRAGYHLIQVLERRTIGFDRVRPLLELDVRRQKSAEPFQRHLADVLQDADIEVNPRIGDLDKRAFEIIDHRFFVPPAGESGVVGPGGGARLPPGLAPGSQGPGPSGG